MHARSKVVARLLLSRTRDEFLAAGKRHGLIVDGKIDVRGEAVRFEHTDLDLSMFLFEETRFGASRFTNCAAAGVSFRRCTFRDVRFECTGTQKRSFANCNFAGSVFRDCYLGPATLDLAGASFESADLRDVTFMLGRLSGASFRNATLEDVALRSAVLHHADFRGATLHRTSLEKADLRDADFGNATFRQMDFWGEPDYTGARIADELRYRFGVVEHPYERLQQLLNRGLVAEPDDRTARTLLDRIPSFAGVPEGMINYDEVGSGIELTSFVRVLKALKDDSLFTS